MRWFKTKDLRSSIYAMFSVSTAKPRPDDPMTMDQIRDAMLAMTAEDSGNAGERDCAAHPLCHGPAGAVVPARGDHAPAGARHGEVAAREKVERSAPCSPTCCPAALRSRPSPLNATYRNSLPFGEDYRTSRPHSDDT